MTILGKIVLLLNLGLSLAFAGWALGVYMNHVPLASRTPEGQEKIVGKVEVLGNQVKKQYQVNAPAEARYQTSRDALLKLEAQRPQLQKWYAEQIDIITKGENVAVLELAVQNGQLVMDPMMRQPVMIGGQAAQTILTYLKKYKNLHAEIAQLQDEMSKLIAEEEKLTLEIGGKKDENGAVVQTGLRDKIQAEETTLKRQGEEQKSLMPELLRYKAEGQLLLKRRDSLKARIDELAGLPPATGD